MNSAERMKKAREKKRAAGLLPKEVWYIEGNERHTQALEAIKRDAKALMKSREGK